MNGDPLYSIGDLARRTGLTVKTIRFYSDRGIVPPTDRGPTGHRLYGRDAVARLDLVRTLRELGLDLSTIRKVADRELTLPDVASAHAQALTVQIRVLRLRRAVLTAAAKRGSTAEEMDLMHKLAQLTEDERRRLIDDFLGAVFGGLDSAPEFVGITRSLTAELPENPTAEQLEAWVELADLSRDPDFRAAVRHMAEQHAAGRSEGGRGPRRDPLAAVRDQVGPALAAGIDPASPAADQVVESVTVHYAHALGRPDDVQLRHELLSRLETADDPRWALFLQLLAVVNGWPAPESPSAGFDWSIRALRARLSGDRAAPSRA